MMRALINLGELGNKKGFAEAPAQMSLRNEKNETRLDNYRFFEFHLSCAEALSAPCSSTVLLPKKRGREIGFIVVS
jgi:hypothetical protein